MTAARAIDDAAPDCVLHHRGEIVALLERIHRERIPTNVECGDGLVVVSSILEVDRDAETLVFDIARDGTTNRRLFDAPSLAFTTELDRIRIAFGTVAATPVDRFDGPAGRVDLPTAVVRLQRRSAFRVPLPETPPVRCTILDAGGHAIPGRAIDVSAGGAAIVIDEPATGVASMTDATVETAARVPIGKRRALVLSLPELGTVALDATLRTANPATAGGDGTPAKVRLGFRFESLPPTTENRIRRLVQHLEVLHRQAERGG